MLSLSNIISKMCPLAICGESSSLNLQIHRLLKCGSCRKITGRMGYRCVGARLRKVQFFHGKSAGGSVRNPLSLPQSCFTRVISRATLVHLGSTVDLVTVYGVCLASFKYVQTESLVHSVFHVPLRLCFMI